MRRLNVREAQIDECIVQSMFALHSRPQNPELQPGELLLLQLVKTEADRLGKADQRINFALVFDRIERDYDGRLSRYHWPNEDRTWNWIVFGSATIPTIPFSLEVLSLSRRYDGQDNARYIVPEDEDRILPFVQWSLAQQPIPERQIVEVPDIARHFGKERALAAIFNHDRIETLHPAPQRIELTPRYTRNRALGDGLKSYYGNRCQVCGQDFEPRFGVGYSETHHIQYLREGGPDVSSNIVVLCPNHHRIVHTTSAQFNRETLAYDYPNGYREPLILPDHLVRSRQLGLWSSEGQPLLRRVAEPPSPYNSD